MLDPLFIAIVFSKARKLADTLIGLPQVPDKATREQLEAHFSEEEIVELALAIGLFLGMSKVLINLGLEPQDMPVTLVPTPGAPAPGSSHPTR